MNNIPTRDDNAGEDADAILTAVRAQGHAWWPSIDHANQTHVWRCICDELVYQPFGAPVPDELISHPQSFGQMRGER